MSKWLERARAKTDGPPVPDVISANSHLPAQTAQTALHPPSLSDNLSAQKALTAQGRPSANDDDAVAEAYAERQAICEVDGRLKRTEAALLAAACTIPLRDGESLESRQATVLHFAEHLEKHRRRREASSRNGGDAA